MGWEHRKRGTQYFYRTIRRPGGRLGRIYYGTGTTGELAAELHAQAQARRAAAASALQAERDRLRPAEQALESLERRCDLLVAAVLYTVVVVRISRPG